MADERGAYSKRITIYDLAQLAGASPSAVSSVLNGSWKKRRISASLAERVSKIAAEQGYAINFQARALRRERSNLIGMIVPKYDNRYFGLIAEKFEMAARDHGLFPIITCTRRDAALEVEAAKAMISHQIDCLISTGATDPDRITELCALSGVRSFNLDLPGSLAPSIISDNYDGALKLTRRILASSASSRAAGEAMLFIGGRITDHNTSERLRGFRDAHAEIGLDVPAENILAPGYAPEKAWRALSERLAQGGRVPAAYFVTATITLEGVVKAIIDCPAYGGRLPDIGCFDWDPLIEVLDKRIVMVRQDVDQMLAALFAMIKDPPPDAPVVMIPTLQAP